MSEFATNGPVASKFVFLKDVATLPPNTKVRLLGCIVDHDTAKGQIILEHAYPKNAKPIPHVLVDIDLVLESIEPSILSTGSWINVIGYTRTTQRGVRKSKARLRQPEDESSFLQAVLVWTAGALKITDYEITLEEQRSAQKNLISKSK
ncbi:hypothetical protein LTR67_003809 [Exophiala xenobiotica]|nr:hypothetical protein LTR47_005494 [Exophiala xenobiotica]KAK5247086.1 hypothetical protein LTS06_007706 [Exophiala xenobiotica]KAK5282416.1 hypothetical protein LTR40_003351 [Exophiala xenobiotica]KAK5349301.1 hypothetical protein LTR61_007339 [Exophiala xenobiotica]KAK5365222.1 hypothetical protein LTR11_008632 [Exophiala xenobiotica]